MKSAQQIADEVELAARKGCSDAIENGHPDLAAFMNKLASGVHWGAPTRNNSPVSRELAEWMPERWGHRRPAKVGTQPATIRIPIGPGSRPKVGDSIKFLDEYGNQHAGTVTATHPILFIAL